MNPILDPAQTLDRGVQENNKDFVFGHERQMCFIITERLNGSICTYGIFHSLDLRVKRPPCFYLIDPIQEDVKTRAASALLRDPALDGS